MINLSLAFLWSFLVAIFAIPSIISVAHNKKLLDQPNDRSIHKQLTPRLGGGAIFVGFMSAITIFGIVDFSIQQILAGCILLFFIGVKDDLVMVSAFKKFFAQVLAICLVMFVGDIRITTLHGILGIHEIDMGLSYGFTLFIVLGLTNAINLIDGMDGLAGSIMLLSCLFFGVYFYFYDMLPYSLLALSLAGGVLGFLRYNIYKAKIFMGDTGSLLGGFIISVMAIKFSEMKHIEAAPSLAMGILVLPIFDTLRVFTLRILKGKSPFIPDKNHIHHRLLALGLTQQVVLAILISVNLIVITLLNLNAHLGNNQLLLIILATLIAFAVFLEFSRRFEAKAAL